MKLRVPIRFVTVFGVTALVALAVGLVFYFGFVSATKNTRSLMSDQASGLINSMERDIALMAQTCRAAGKLDFRSYFQPYTRPIQSGKL